MTFPIAPNEAERLENLHKLQIIGAPSTPALERICRVSAQALNVPNAYVTLMDERQQWIMASSGRVSRPAVSLDYVFCNYTILQDDVFVVPDTHADERYALNRYVSGEPHTRFYAGAPLTIAPGIRVGALCVVDRQPRDLSQDEIALLQRLSRLVINEIWLCYLETTGKAGASHLPFSVLAPPPDMGFPTHPTSALIRAGRGLLNWSSQDLANAAGVSLASIKRIETLGKLPLASGS